MKTPLKEPHRTQRSRRHSHRSPTFHNSTKLSQVRLNTPPNGTTRNNYMRTQFYVRPDDKENLLANQLCAQSKYVSSPVRQQRSTLTDPSSRPVFGRDVTNMASACRNHERDYSLRYHGNDISNSQTRKSYLELRQQENMVTSSLFRKATPSSNYNHSAMWPEKGNTQIIECPKSTLTQDSNQQYTFIAAWPGESASTNESNQGNPEKRYRILGSDDDGSENRDSSSSSSSSVQNCPNNPTVAVINRAFKMLTSNNPNPSLFLQILSYGKKNKQPQGWIASKLFPQGTSGNNFLSAKLLDLTAATDAALKAILTETYDVRSLEHAFDVKMRTIIRNRRSFLDASRLYQGPELYRDFSFAVIVAEKNKEIETLQKNVESLSNTLSKEKSGEVRRVAVEYKSEKYIVHGVPAHHDVVLRRTIINHQNGARRDREKNKNLEKVLEGAQESVSVALASVEREKLKTCHEICQKQKLAAKVASLENTILSLKEEIDELRPAAQKWEAAKARFQRKEYPKRCRDSNIVDWGRVWMGFATTMCPMASPYAMEQLCVFMTMSLLADIKILEEPCFDRNLVPTSLPCRKTLSSLLVEFSTLVYLSKISKLRRAPQTYLALDKSVRGKTVNKVSHFAKMVCFVDPDRPKPEIDTWCFDAGGSEGSSEDCALSIAHAVNNKLLGAINQVNGISGDNGGGDSGKPLAVELKKLGMLSETFFVVCNCNHHNLNLLEAPGVTKTSGEGGLGKRNMLQFMHCKKDLQDAHERLEWITISRIEKARALGTSHHDIDIDEMMSRKQRDVKAKGEPTTTRWEGVGIAARAGQDNNAAMLDLKIAQGVMQRDPTRKAANKIASGLVSLYREKEIEADQRLIACYTEMITAWAYDAFKARGPHSKRSGFASENVLIVQIILVSRLDNHADNKWKTADTSFGFKEFNDFVETELTAEKMNASQAAILKEGARMYDEEEACAIRERQGIKANKLFELGQRRAKKHFTNWANSLLLLCALGCNYGFVAQIVAIFICYYDKDDADNDLDPFDSVLGSSFEFDDFDTVETVEAITIIEYLKDRCKKLNEIRSHDFFKDNKESIQKIARGGKLWEDKDLKEFREVYFASFTSIPSTNQICELMFKMLTDIASVHGRSEITKTIYLASITGIQQRAKRMAHKKSLAKPRRKPEHEDNIVVAEGDDHSHRIQQRHVRGAVFSSALMDEVEHAVHIATRLDDFVEARSKLTATFTDHTKDFKYERVKKKIVQYIKAQDKTTKLLNAKAKETGVDVTDVVDGKLQFSLIGRAHVPLLIPELILHGLVEGVDFNREMGITEMKKILKEKLGLPEKEKSFYPKSATLVEVCNGVLDDIVDQVTMDDEDEDEGESSSSSDIEFSALKNANSGVDYLRHELTARGVAFESSALITNLKKVLRAHLGCPTKKRFTPVSEELINAIANNSL